MVTEQEVRTRADWIGVEISRSRVRTPSKAGYGLYRVRGSILTTVAAMTGGTYRTEVHPTEWTAYAFALAEVDIALCRAIQTGIPAEPGVLMLMPSQGSDPELPLGLKVPARWTQQYRGRRDLGVRAGVGAPVLGAGLRCDPELHLRDGHICPAATHEPHRSPDTRTLLVDCRDAREPDGTLCPGRLLFGPGDPQARCPVCGGWIGRLAPGVMERAKVVVAGVTTDPRQDGKTVRQRQREFNGAFQAEHQVRRDHGLKARHERKLRNGDT